MYVYKCKLIMDTKKVKKQNDGSEIWSKEYYEEIMKCTGIGDSMTLLDKKQ